MQASHGDEKTVPQLNGVIAYQNETKGSPHSGFNMGLIDEYK